MKRPPKTRRAISRGFLRFYARQREERERMRPWPRDAQLWIEAGPGGPPRRGVPSEGPR